MNTSFSQSSSSRSDHRPRRASMAQHLSLLGAVVALALMSARQVVETAVDRVATDQDRGEVSSTTIMIAVLVSLAVAVGLIITTKITAKANGITP